MVKVSLPSYEDIIEQVTNAGGDGGRALVERAYECAQKAHKGQFRRSGHPYIIHCLAVAGILSDLNCDPTTIAAAFLHDVVEDTVGTPRQISIEQVQREFGAEVATLVDGVTKLAHFDKLSSDDLDENVQALRKMFMAMVEDVRVVLIKLADRIHNMRTLSALPAERQQQIARETIEIFAPLANRLGIWEIKWELEDLAFRHLYPADYKEIANLIKQRQADRETHVARVIKRLKERLDSEGLAAEVSGRPKHIYSIYRKMKRKGVSFEQIFDVRGVRIIVEDVPQCYHVLGTVHGMWQPIPGEFDDYIATPKDNMYRSLHTAVLDEDGTPLEVQIRTYDMHKTAEYGIAAHWKYKDDDQHEKQYEHKIAWLRSLMDWRQEVVSAGEFLDALKTDVFQDRVYAFTPKGKLIDLPAGSTPIDFAYNVHSSVGDRCRGAKVNGNLVTLDYQLKTGDQVDILTSKRGGPSRDWLNPHLGYLKTQRARTKIRQWFKRQDRQQNIADGHTVLDKEVKRLDADIKYEDIAKLFGFDELDDFLAAIGQGDISTQQIATKVIEAERSQNPDTDPGVPFIPPVPKISTGALSVMGTGGLLSHYGLCCNPLPGDEIIGYVTRGRGVTIHKQDCPNILRTREHERLIDVNWGAAEQTYPVMIEITAYDRSGLLRDFGTVVANQKVSMSSVSTSTQKNITTIYATLQVSSIAQLSRVLTKLGQLRNVLQARRKTD